MNKAIWLAKRNYWIAGIGAIISVLSFLVFPFLSFKSLISVPLFRDPISSQAQSVGAMPLALHQGLLWVSLLLVLAVLGGSIVFLVRQSPFGSRAPVQVQARWVALGFVATGVLSALCLVASLLLIQQDTQNRQDLVQELLGTLGLSSSVTSTWGIGAYLFLAGLVTIVVAGIMEAISPVKMLSDGEMIATQNQYPPSNYPPTVYGSTSMNQGGPPFADASTQYGEKPVSGPQPPTSPYPQ